MENKNYVNVEGRQICKHCMNTGKLYFGGYCGCDHGKKSKELDNAVLKDAIQDMKKEYAWLWENGTCAKDPNPDDKLDAVAYALQHPLYKEAHETWAKVQTEQIKKGAEKYPEPLNDEDYTAEELFFHAVQENVDQMHYLQALRKKNQKLETENVSLVALKDLLEIEKEELKKWKTKYHSRIKELETECGNWEAENKLLKAELGNSENMRQYWENKYHETEKNNDAITENCQLRKNVMELEVILDDRTKDVKKLYKENEELKAWKTNMLQQIENMAKKHLDKKGCKYDR